MTVIDFKTYDDGVRGLITIDYVPYWDSQKQKVFFRGSNPNFYKTKLYEHFIEFFELKSPESVKKLCSDMNRLRVGK
jgi:hypothetical protein